MKRITGTVDTCLQQAKDLCWDSRSEAHTPATRAVRCQLQGKLVSGLYLIPGETEGITLKRLGEAMSTQARISSSPLEQQLAILEYDETGVGLRQGDRRIMGILSLTGEPEPVALLYCLDDEAREPQQQ